MTPSPLSSPLPAARDRSLDALVAADRWSVWRTLTRGLAHHLANAAQMLALDPAPAIALTEAVERVSLAQLRLSGIHRDDTPGPASVPEVLEDVQAMQRLQVEFPSVEIALVAEPGLHAVGMPAADLRHVLLSLVTNAKQAARGGRATIGIEARGMKDGVEIGIRDGGPGLPPAMHERAFEPFVTTRDDGALGLGLYVARALAQRAGGTLDLDPGSRGFRLRVPAWQRALPT